jgi:hypothetical protein
VHGPPAHHLRRWDQLSSGRRIPAIGGLDGHAPGIRVRGRVRSPLSHARTFSLLRTHLVCDHPLSGDTAADRQTIVDALAAGAAWLSCPFVAPATGARMWAEQEDGATLPMGAQAPAVPAVLRVRLPRAAELIVVRDGAPMYRVHAATLDLDIERGVHRVEARVDGRLWLLSNPIHLR